MIQDIQTKRHKHLSIIRTPLLLNRKELFGQLTAGRFRWGVRGCDSDSDSSNVVRLIWILFQLNRRTFSWSGAGPNGGGMDFSLQVLSSKLRHIYVAARMRVAIQVFIFQGLMLGEGVRREMWGYPDGVGWKLPRKWQRSEDMRYLLHSTMYRRCSCQRRNADIGHPATTPTCSRCTRHWEFGTGLGDDGYMLPSQGRGDSDFDQTGWGWGRRWVMTPK